MTDVLSSRTAEVTMGIEMPQSAWDQIFKELRKIAEPMISYNPDAQKMANQAIHNSAFSAGVVAAIIHQYAKSDNLKHMAATVLGEES